MKPLTEHIRKWHQENDRQPGDDAGAIHPSSLGDCNRRTIYKYMGVPRNLGFNDYKKAIFFHGYAIEDMMNEALEDQSLLIAKNVPVRAMYDGIPVEGTIDQIIRWEDGWAIADTKSVSDHAFKHKSFPYQHHVLQVGCYQWALIQMMEGHDWPPATLSALDVFEEWDDLYPPLLFYVGRGNLKELGAISAGDGAMDLALEKLEEVAQYIKQEVYPPRPFQSPEEHPYLCSSCIRRGYQKRDGTYNSGSEPLYVPNCEYFLRCWGVMPDEWSFWWEVAGREELTF